LRKFNIVIPTKDRCETLEWTLRSCLAIEYPNFEIIVSDNCSEDQTSEIVQSFSDSRIKYYRTPKKLGMTANWEFALSKVQEGMVSILGDDDAFMPDSLQRINRLLDESQADAIAWKQSFYRWPSNHFVRIKNLLSIPFDRKVEIRHGQRELEFLLALKRLPADMPWLYAGFVDIKYIRQIKDSCEGNFFFSKIPDIYSSIVLASVIDRYVFSSYPLSIAGHSSKSNGAAQIQSSEHVVEQNTQFLKESISHPFHEKLEFVHVYPVLIWECYLQAKEKNIIPDGIQFNAQFMLDEAVRDCIRLNFLDRDKDLLRAIAMKNNLRLRMPEYKTMVRLANKSYKVKTYLSTWLSNHFLMCDEYGIHNIYEAANHHRSLEQKVTSRWQLILGNIQLLFKTL